VIEAWQIRPRFDCVARLASLWLAVGAQLRQLQIKFAVMRIFVAARAGEVVEMIRRVFGSSFAARRYMAFRTRYGEMSARQRVTRLLMQRNREGGRLKPPNRMTWFALVVVGGPGELAAVLVLVAVRALRKGDFVTRRGPCGNVAFVACYARVFSIQRIADRRMCLDVEERGLPSIHRVARGTLAFVRTGGKLAAVWIDRVAVRASREGNFFFEITSPVASEAIHFRMQSQQRIFGLGMIKRFIRRNFSPSGRGVAGIAGLCECAVMRIRMAIAAFRERDSREASFASGLRRGVTSFACDLGMKASERISCLRVVKIPGGLPIREIVALQAVLSQLPVMNVVVAGNAILR
jgi:hypothetical protein